ncbi:MULTISPECIES: DUF1040 family protein [unclassified Colwellia]|jgi:hypothetical protein|uniref:DUF1040 family protein n=1 Tax=unclassified Colwellia TaxID=196834 RepID=UPI0015F35473|nr:MULTISPECIES: DUF1040 family protein [unclassified Colwellia]MBA6258244.1 DUF1040 family protein [Colwellia sp. MB3u-28]MBA6258510.1 DUF1040 family protein [Colwellia sp. MB3u-41]
MRDPKRIDTILELINEIWLQDPDMRFNQLIYSLQNSYSYKNNEIGRINEVESDGFTRTGFDLFNLEDDSFIEYLEKVKISGNI